MRLKQFALLLLITFYSNKLLSEQHNNLKNLQPEKGIQSTLNNKTPSKLIIHIVKKGDTLSSISKQYSIKKETIIKVNRLLDENYIYIGQNLKIIENLISDNNNNHYYHEIKKGENLTEIANKYNLSLDKLVEINDIKNQNILEVGTKLKLKEDLYVKKDSRISQVPDLIEGDKLLKNKYGPLIIDFDKTNLKKRKNFLKVTHKNGKKLILQINCNKKEINVRGIGRQWKGWMPAKEEFEVELLNDFCLEFD